MRPFLRDPVSLKKYCDHHLIAISESGGGLGVQRIDNRLR
jgi:hypothetical protein